ncbi:outer membrane beta-barrel protein [Candidatus Peregrinibacteria bacterium]|nr:outer membrane beta-barrel protein [Candidatus Peregrinibacteria bacterium]
MKLQIIILVLFAICTPLQSKNKITVGLKAGCVYHSLSLSRIDMGVNNEDYPKQLKSPGIVFEFLMEKDISDQISLISNISYYKYNSNLRIYQVYEELEHYNFQMEYIRFPFLVKFHTRRFINPYFLAGINIGYLLKAQCGLFRNWKIIDITKELHRLDGSIDLGFGIPIECWKFKILYEIRYQIGIRENYYHKIDLGSNRTFLFIVGIQFN